VNKFEVEAKKIREVLNLKWPPIAGQFTNNADENGDSSKKLGICDAFDLVRRKNIVLNISKVNCTCAGGRHFTGLEILPIESIAPGLAKQRHKIYDSINTAVASVNRQPQPVNRGDFFILGPLAKFESNPDIVFFFTNAAQAERLLGLISFKGAEPLTYYPATSICSTITNVLASRRPQINLIAHFERREGKWSQNEFITALPLKAFEAAIKNIPHSGYGTFKP
jgi:uncharacterized protein (DUF169 family)